MTPDLRTSLMGLPWLLSARDCVHAASKAKTVEGVGVWDRQQALVILFL